MFRPCIDLREGRVTQIVGNRLQSIGTPGSVNFVSDLPARDFAERYRRDQLTGGHVILLDQLPATRDQALQALAAWPGGLHLGGGITATNARAWLDAGASHVIVTSWVFHDGQLDQARLDQLVTAVGRHRLVLDLSCRRQEGDYLVMTDRWSRATEVKLGPSLLERLSHQCAEFLVHATDVEGQCRGIDRELVALLADWSPIPVVYAGGARSLSDLEDVERLSRGKVDLTIGSALDLFGGDKVRYADAVAFNRRRMVSAPPG